MRQFQNKPTTYVTVIKEIILKYTLNKYHVHWLSSFQHLKLPISIKITVTIWQIVFIATKFDFINYAFSLFAKETILDFHYTKG